MNMKKTKKRWIGILALLLIPLLLSACGSKSNRAMYDDKGNPLYLRQEDIGTNYSYGFYVMHTQNEVNYFTPLMRNIAGYTSTGTSVGSSTGRIFWWLDGKDKDGVLVNHKKLTPVVTKDAPLVAIFDSTKEMPSTLRLERYRNLGYTFGAKFYLGDDEKTLYLSNSEQDLLSDSSIAKILTGGGKIDQDKLEIISINDIPASDIIGNVDTEANILTGFSDDQKGKYFTVKFFLGTKTMEMTPIVDTEAFKASNTLDITSPYKKTTRGFYLVNLPENLAEGYYFIENQGLFYYKK